MTKGGHKEVVWPNATTNVSDVGTPELILLFVKSFDTQTAIQDIVSLITENSYIMTLQNGIGNAEKIAKFIDERKIIVGVTAIGSAIVKPGQIELTDAAYSGRGGTDFNYYRQAEDPNNFILNKIIFEFLSLYRNFAYLRICCAIVSK